MTTEMELNYETFKKQNEELRKINRKLLKTFIKHSPRETVIEILKELKILKTGLNLETDKLELMER